ncbi:MAG TPA: UDP-N-acetylglucosamine 2-epimerase (non-hydrolyzing) [Verrucomicrobiae bacterium]
MKTKILIVAGARPNFMKIAPLIKAVGRHNQANPQKQVQAVLVHTGQHYDAKMSDVFFTELGIPAPDINLAVGSGSHAVQTANIMTAFEPVCLQEKPDWIVVVGDVNSTMGCTLVASKLGIKVAHLEAGLRSFDRTMPEEVNRLVTDCLADLLLTPSADGDENLLREGVPASKIKLVGNIMIDSLIENLPQARSSTILARHELKKKNFVYVTLHRPSNVDAPENLNAIMELFGKLAARIPIVFPMHPRTRKMLSQSGTTFHEHPNFTILEPIGYHDSLCLTENARLVLTDSGGLQEESTYFRTPCLTLRPNTERPVTVTLGSNKLTTVKTLWSDLDQLLNAEPVRGQIPPLWDGKTAERVLSCLLGS